MDKFTCVEDIGDLRQAVAEALEIKRDRFQFTGLGRNKTLLMLFFNSSLRTRLSTQKAAMNLGMNVMVLDVNQGAWKLETERGVVMDGRDIGTVVLPDATVKIFLTATPEARATRRWKEYQAKGIDTPYEEVLADVKQRDYQDTHRAAAPLKQAEDAVLLDTSELDFEQSLDAMKQIIAKKIGG